MAAAFCMLVVVGVVGAAILSAVVTVKAQQSNNAALAQIGPVVEMVGDSAALFLDPPRIALANARAGDPALSASTQQMFREMTVHSYEVQPITSALNVTVDVDGGINTVRGRNLGAKAAGGIATGGLGLFVFGNAKNENIDLREVYLTFVSDTWSHVEKVDKKHILQARQFAARVNQIARGLAATEDDSYSARHGAA